jgi:tetratricopeptide (TPR) repeat protein
MHASRILLILALAGPLSAAARADAPGTVESMPEHRLKEIVEHQKILFTDAASQGRDLDNAAFRAQVEQLTREYESLLRDNPNFAAGFATYGYMLRKVGLEQQALAMLIKANQLDPDIPLVKNELGNYLAEQGKPLEAVNYFLAAIKLEPGEPLYHYQLGTLLYEARDDFMRSGEWTRASIDKAMLDAFRKAAELAPDRIEFVYRYAESFYDMGDPDWASALKVWERLEAHGESEIERQTMRLHEANVLLYMGRTDDARGVLDRVTDPALEAQKEKLVARLSSGGGK